MKKIILVIFALLSIFSCRGDDNEDNAFLLGDWNWVSTVGGISGQINDTPTSTGKTVVITFTADNKYVIITNGTTTNSGTYNIYKDTSNTDHLEKKYIGFSEGYSKIITSYDETSLVLSDDANDGTTSAYEKK